MQPVQRPFRQAVDATGAALLGAGFAVLLAITTCEQPSRSVETIAADLNGKVTRCILPDRNQTGKSRQGRPRHPVKLLAEDFPANGRIGERTRRSALAGDDVAIAARFPLSPVVANWNYTRAIADSSVEPKFGQPAALFAWNTDRRPPAHLRAARRRTGSRGRIRYG